MNKKIFALLLAAVLALAGVAATISYAQGADARAYGDAELTAVLVVTQPVPAGSPANRLAGSVETIRVPKSVVAEGAVTDLASLGGEVATAALVPGEQVLAGRFGTERKPVDATDLPPGMQEMDLILPAPRMPAGSKAGSTVGVVASYSLPNGAPGLTRMISMKVRITALKEGAVGGTGTDAPAAEGVKVTLAVTTHQAEKIANAAEFGKIWLTSQNAKADVKGSKLTDMDEVLK